MTSREPIKGDIFEPALGDAEHLALELAAVLGTGRPIRRDASGMTDEAVFT